MNESTEDRLPHRHQSIRGESGSEKWKSHSPPIGRAGLEGSIRVQKRPLLRQHLYIYPI